MDPATYREPLEPPSDPEALDIALAHEIYEAQRREEHEREARQRKAEEKKRDRALRRMRRVRVETATPHDYLVVRQTRFERFAELANTIYFGGVLMSIPVLLYFSADLFDASVMKVVGVASIVLVVLFIRAIYRRFRPYTLVDTLRLRVTPLHYEIIREGHRHVGERNELELRSDEDSFQIDTPSHRFRIDDLHPADVDLVREYWAREKLCRG